MRTTKFFIAFVMMVTIGPLVFGQGKKSTGDAYFFQYEYQQAIQAYEEEMLENELTPLQNFNLADSYFKTNNFEKASSIYFDLFKQDSLMGNHHFNKMLQSFSKVGDNNRVMAIMETKSAQLGQDMLENAEFNIELLNSNPDGGSEFEIFNLESNSPQTDFSPAFYNKEKLLFSSGRPQEKKKNYAPMSEAYLDIYVGRINSDKQVLNPNPFDGIAKSDYHKATPYYSEALNSVLYVLSNTENGDLKFDDNGKNTLAMGMQNIDGPFNMILSDLSTSFYYPFYDENTGRLYFAANFDDGYGGTDIYYIYTNNGQVMSAPVNLGPRINSPGNEIAPYMFDNSLYFASDVFYGLGGMDIYRSTIEDQDSYGIPVNLGAKVNSPKDDFGFIIRDDGEGFLGYFTSNRDGGKGKDDIYGFKVSEKQKPGLKTITLQGAITKSDSNITGVEKAMVRLSDIKGNLIKETYTNEEGMYRIEVPWVENVVLLIKKERHSIYTERLQFLTGPDQETNFKVDVNLAYYNDLVEEKEGQKVVKLKKFSFDKNKKTINDNIAKELDKVVDFVKSFPRVQLRIETYTDSRGGSSANFKLTQARSDAIKKYLIKKGVSRSNILYSMGFGEQKLLNKCKNGVFCIEKMHQKNQRSLIVVLNDNLLFK